MEPSSVYSHSRTEGEFDTPDYASIEPRYAVPDHMREDAPWNDTFGWAPALRLGPNDIPDTSRLGTQPRREFRPDPVRPPDEFWGRIDADDKSRHSAEDIDADGFTETKQGFGLPNPASGANRFAPNPRSVPQPETRPTQQMAPRTYTFLRPFMTGLAKMGSRSLNGEHFSMADHRRNYEILGMAPQRTPGAGTRNTYRLTPQPWDTDMVDVPPSGTSVPFPAVQPVPSVDVAYTSRAWRL